MISNLSDEVLSFFVNCLQGLVFAFLLLVRNGGHFFMYDFMLVLFSCLFLIAGFLLPILRSFQSRCDRYKPMFDFN